MWICSRIDWTRCGEIWASTAEKLPRPSTTSTSTSTGMLTDVIMWVGRKAFCRFYVACQILHQDASSESQNSAGDWHSCKSREWLLSYCWQCVKISNSIVCFRSYSLQLIPQHVNIWLPQSLILFYVVCRCLRELWWWEMYSRRVCSRKRHRSLMTMNCQVKFLVLGLMAKWLFVTTRPVVENVP